MVSQKAATKVLEPETPHTNGQSYVFEQDQETLRFDPKDPSSAQYRHLHIVCNMKVPMDVYFRFAKALPEGDEYYERLEARHRDFAREMLVSWNMKHPKTGEPIPPTEEGMLQIPLDVAGDIRSAWFYTLSTPSNIVPLESPPSNTAPLA